MFWFFLSEKSWYKILYTNTFIPSFIFHYITIITEQKKQIQEESVYSVSGDKFTLCVNDMNAVREEKGGVCQKRGARLDSWR